MDKFIMLHEMEIFERVINSYKLLDALISSIPHKLILFYN